MSLHGLKGNPSEISPTDRLFFVQVLQDYLDFLIMTKVPVLLDLYSPYYKGGQAPKQTFKPVKKKPLTDK